MFSCCPENSWGQLNNPDYKVKGVVEKIPATDIEVYHVGKSEKCIIWNYDVYGFDGGRSRQMADFVADHGQCHSISSLLNKLLKMISILRLIIV